MKLERLQDAIEEAERFVFVAKVARKTLKDDAFYRGKDTAAVGRASMDLTRALARLRNEP